MSTENTLANRQTNALGDESAVTSAVAELAEKLGESRIRPITPDYVDMLKEGLLIDLFIGFPRFESALTHQHLGIDTDNMTIEQKKAWDDAVTLGKIRLRPKEWMRKVERAEGQARDLLFDFSSPTPWGRKRFVKKGRPCDGGNATPEAWRTVALVDGELVSTECEPGTKGAQVLCPVCKEWNAPDTDQRVPAHVDSSVFLEWREQHNALRARFMGYAAEMLEKWDEHQDWAIATLMRLGYDAYARLLAAGVKGLPDDAETWVREQFVQPAMLTVPTKEKAFARFRFDYDKEYVPLAAELATDQAEARRIVVERETEMETARLVALARSEMDREVLAAANAQKLQKWTAFWDDAQSRVTAIIHDTAVNITAAVQRNDGLPPSSYTELRNLLTKVSRLKFVPDDKTDAEVETVRLMLEAASAGSAMASPKMLHAAFRQIAAETRLALADMDRLSERQVREWMEADLPTDEADIEALALGRQVRRYEEPAQDSLLGDVPARQVREAA